MKKLVILPLILSSFVFMHFSCESVALSFTITNNNSSSITAITVSSSSNASSIISTTIASGASYSFGRELLAPYRGAYLYIWVDSTSIGSVFVDGEHTYEYDASGNFNQIS